MGKNHRHKKNVKADKAKVKLKQTKTKFLPKGLNETKTNFKIKPIVLGEQLKDKSSNIPLSKRKLNIKDLLTRMNHYNENVRFSACQELTDMYKHSSKDIVREHLAEVILKVSSLMQDKERKVRNATIKAINVILEETPPVKLEPFFKHFSVNLRCAMTNIDQGIQEDSLRFIDCFLAKDCGLISKTSEKFLPDFFTLISRLRSDNNLGRTLTINLGSRMTSVTWRIKVLHRLHAVLSLILKNEEKEVERNVDVFADITYNLRICDFIYYNKLLKSTQETFENNSSKTILNSHLSTLIPVFYDIWTEVVPEKGNNSSQEGTYLNEEPSAILWCLVNTIYLMWKYLDKNATGESDLKNIFASPESTKFLNHLMIGFPYCQNDRKPLVKTKSQINLQGVSTNVMDPNCVKINMIICYIYFVLNANFSRNTSKTEMKKICTYFNKCLLTENYVNKFNIQYVIEFTKLCLLEQSVVWNKCQLDAKEVLKNVMAFYNSPSIGEKNKMRLFDIFLGLYDNPALSGSSHYISWLFSLPELLCNSHIHDSTAEALLALARKNCIHFITAIKLSAQKILKNLDSLAIIMTKKSYKNEKDIKRELIFIFYYIKGMTCSDLKSIFESVSNHISKEDCFLLKERLHKCPPECKLLDSF